MLQSFGSEMFLPRNISWEEFGSLNVDRSVDFLPLETHKLKGLLQTCMVLQLRCQFLTSNLLLSDISWIIRKTFDQIYCLEIKTFESLQTTKSQVQIVWGLSFASKEGKTSRTSIVDSKYNLSLTNRWSTVPFQSGSPWIHLARRASSSWGWPTSECDCWSISRVRARPKTSHRHMKLFPPNTLPSMTW